MAGADKLDPLLRAAIRSGAMTEAEARDVDAFADGIVARVREGQLTVEQAAELARRQGTQDALARNRARGRKR